MPVAKLAGAVRETAGRPEYGPYTTVYNRFNRWSRQGIWLGMLEALTGHCGV